MEELEVKIEYLRQKMHITALEKGIRHPEVLMISQELDTLLNQFYKDSLIKKYQIAEWIPVYKPLSKQGDEV